MNIYQINTYRKELSWLHFDDKPRVQERQQEYAPAYIFGTKQQRKENFLMDNNTLYF